MQRLFRSLHRTVFTLRNRHGLSHRFYVQAASNGPSKSLEEKEQSDERPSSSSVIFADKLKDARVRMREYLRQMSGNSAVTIRKRADDFTASTETLFSRLGDQLNKATGYEDIEVLKSNVVKQEARINAAREAAIRAKKAYEEAVVRRSRSQREVNELLQRKSNWTDSDVGRFTTLVREDHLYEQNEFKAKEVVTESDAVVDRELNELLRVILARYHEEQVWSDKIRSASTYGSMAALGLNLLVFMVATLAVEPWKRRRLAHTFEQKVDELSVQTRQMVLGEIQKINDQLMNHERMIGRWTDDDETLALTVATVVDKESPRPATPLEWLKGVGAHREVTIALGAALLGWLLGSKYK